jgi:hypothetical protein
LQIFSSKLRFNGNVTQDTAHKPPAIDRRRGGFCMHVLLKTRFFSESAQVSTEKLGGLSDYK